MSLVDVVLDTIPGIVLLVLFSIMVATVVLSIISG
jgi:hypothetical protein